MPIHNVLILKSSGQNIFSWTQRSFNLDDDLLSSFTSAIFTFVSELGEKSIEIMDLENLKFLYSYEPKYDLIFSMSIDRDDEKQLGTYKTVLEEIKTSFVEKYGATFLENWNGEVSVFKEFEPEVDRIVQTIQEYIMDHIIAIPFLVDENNEEITNFQQEVAIMFLLSENEREKGGGRLRKKPSEVFDYLTKVLWPFWVINTEQGPVIVDGFALPSQKRVITKPITLKSFEEILKTSAPNSLIALDKCEVLLDQVSKKEINLDALIEPEFLKAMLKILLTVQYYEPSKIFSEPLRSVLSENKAVVYGKTLEEYFELTKLTTQSLDQLERVLITTTNDWKRELDNILREINEEFSNKFGVTKAEVKKTTEKLALQREKEIESKEFNEQSDIEELYQIFLTEAKILGENTKSLLRFSGQILQSTPSTSHEELTQAFKENVRRIRLLLSSIESAFHDTEDTLNKIEIKHDELQYSLQKAIKEIVVKYNNLVSEQNERIILQKRELEEKLASIGVSKEILEAKRDKLLGMIDTMKQGIKDELEDLNTFIIPSGSIPAALTKHAIISYMPCYITKFVNIENEEVSRFVVIPPCYLHSKYKPLSKKISISVDPLFFDDVKKRLEIAIEERQELKRIFDSVGTQNNFLKDKEIEPLLYDGLKQLLEQKLISSKEYERMSLACIEAFRR